VTGPSQSVATIQTEFQTATGQPAAVIASAPGRVNLIGEHTDYNDGLVLPLGLSQRTWVAVAPRGDGQLRVIARDLETEVTFPLSGWSAEVYPHWSSYVAGVATLLAERAATSPDGADVLIRSDVPVGSGLSSSAALEVSVAAALAELWKLPLNPVDRADLARAAEHRYAGVPCGIMDQFASSLAEADAALLIDCRSRAVEAIPLELGDRDIVIINSGIRHDLATSAYAERQQQCHAATAHFQQHDRAIKNLRDVTPGLLERAADGLDPVLLARARHVVTENERVRAMAAALQGGDFEQVGALLLAGHASLRDDYAVSCAEIDRLVEVVAEVTGVAGVRLTGGGFGGCVVAVAARNARPAIEQAVRSKYDPAVGVLATVIVTAAGPGARVDFKS
jgi:galactokinase